MTNGTLQAVLLSFTEYCPLLQKLLDNVCSINGIAENKISVVYCIIYSY